VPELFQNMTLTLALDTVIHCYINFESIAFGMPENPSIITGKSCTNAQNQHAVTNNSEHSVNTGRVDEEFKRFAWVKIKRFEWMKTKRFEWVEMERIQFSRKQKISQPLQTGPSTR